ncbi:MAG: DUF2461 domain-containing protein [Bacteroidota bacterium]
MITEKYTTFFSVLEENNNKEWFHEHKSAYEADVKKPFLELLEELIPEVEKLEPAISPNPKDALFRINRDIRFAKDKSPYRTLMKAGFSPGGKKSELPGFYLGISADKIHVGGGLFNIQSPQLKIIRRLITEKTDEFLAIINFPSFKNIFGELQGERAKRLDLAFQDTLNETPYVANKQFYVMQQMDLQPFLNSDNLREVVIQYFKEVNPLNRFLKKALLDDTDRLNTTAK